MRYKRKWYVGLLWDSLAKNYVVRAVELMAGSPPAALGRAYAKLDPGLTQHVSVREGRIGATPRKWLD